MAILLDVRHFRISRRNVSRQPDVAHALLGLAGNATRRELAGPIQSGHLARIPLVMVALHTGTMRDERGCNYFTHLAPLVKGTGEDIARATPQYRSAPPIPADLSTAYNTALQDGVPNERRWMHWASIGASLR